MKKFMRAICILLTAVLVLSLVPAAFAAEETGSGEASAPADTEQQTEPVKLPTPENLDWGMYYHYENGELKSDFRTEELFSPSFTAAYLPKYNFSTNEGCRFELKFFQVDTQNPTWYYGPGWYEEDQSPLTSSGIGNIFNCYQDTIPEWDSHFCFELTSGEYYFTVQLLGDGINYLDSDIAESEHWIYERPEAQLSAPTDLDWDGYIPVYKITEDEKTNTYGCQISVFFSPTEDTENLQSIHSIITPYDFYTDDYDDYQDYIKDTFNNQIFSKYGDGYYYFRVRTLSNDIRVTRTSPWSELSPVYNVTTISGEARKQLGAIAETEGNPTKAVQALGTDFLETALAADKGQEGGVADLLSQLEKKTGIEVNVTNGEELVGFDSQDVSIVGAALNNVQENTKEIVLKVDKPQKENVLPKEYDNTIAVSFSMGLEGVADQEHLQVPVKITMPIPDGIRPNRLHILHYEQDGSVNSILPYVFQKDGKWYASFVLRSFSDFTMTEKLISLTLDANGGTLSGESAVTLPSSGKLDELPAAPTRSGYNFLGWYTEAAGGTQVTTDTVFEEDSTIYAHWEAVQLPSPSPAPSFPSSSFPSVPSPAKYSIDVPDAENGTVTVNPKSAAEGDNVSVTATPDTGYVLKELTVTGENNEKITVTDEGNSVYSFTMPGYAVTVTAVFSKTVSISFEDVDKNSYYYDAVKWALENDITTGTGYNTFSPDDPCTRAQIVTFLWRAHNKPVPSTVNNPFTDVDPSSPYYKAILWAVENGITNGTTPTTFSPNDPCTRSQAVTFMWRADNKPVVSRDSGFSDVPAGEWYSDAVKWAVSNGITTGKTAGTFAPNDTCSRAQIVTFLYRNAVK